ncbi:MAG: hypothetical protein ACI9S8_001158 [Chlamydiales bacterium]|jgi:hypothetical protein
MILDIDRLQVNAESEMDVSVIKVGSCSYPVVVMDNVYSDPDYIRELALFLEYDRRFSDTTSRSLGVYPKGLKEIARIGLDQRHFFEVLHKNWANHYIPDREKFISHIPREVIFSRLNPSEGSFDKSFAKPRYGRTMFSGVLYLNTDEQCRGGLGFYLHRRTGFDEFLDLSLMEAVESKTSLYDKSVLGAIYDMSSFDKVEYLRDVGKLEYYSKSLKIIHNEPIVRKAYTSGSDETWLLFDFVEMKFNRLVFFPSFVFHAQHYQDNWFGNFPETQCLTQEFAYHWIPTANESHSLG